jgi:hypothetical protein
MEYKEMQLQVQRQIGLTKTTLWHAFRKEYVDTGLAGDPAKFVAKVIIPRLLMPPESSEMGRISEEVGPYLRGLNDIYCARKRDLGLSTTLPEEQITYAYLVRKKTLSNELEEYMDDKLRHMLPSLESICAQVFGPIAGDSDSYVLPVAGKPIGTGPMGTSVSERR